MKDCAICAGRQFAGVSHRLLSAVSAGHVMMTDFTLRSIRSPCFRRRGRKIITPGRGTFNEDKLDFKAVESCEGREVSLRDLHGASAFRTHSSESPTCRSTWILKHADCQNFVNLWRHIPKDHLTRRVSSTRALLNSAGSAKLVHLRCKWAALARSQIVVTCLFYKCQNQYDPHTKGIKTYRIIPPIDKSLSLTTAAKAKTDPKPGHPGPQSLTSTTWHGFYFDLPCLGFIGCRLHWLQYDPDKDSDLSDQLHYMRLYWLQAFKRLRFKCGHYWAGVRTDFIVKAQRREDGRTKWLLTFIYIR